MEPTQLLEAISTRRKGNIRRASDYVGSLINCADDNTCANLFSLKGFRWQDAMKVAGQKLVYADDRTSVARIFKDGGSKTLTPNCCMELDCVITTTKMDRDEDVLECKGAIVDPKMCFLWMHEPAMYLGKLVKILVHNHKKIVGRFAILDNQLGRDIAAMIAFGGIRISHGFRPLKGKELRSKDGQAAGRYHIEEYEMFEVSAVTIPSNTDAEIESVTNKCTHPVVKSWLIQEASRASQLSKPTQGTSAVDMDVQKTGMEESSAPACGCKSGAKVYSPLVKPSGEPLRWNKSLSKNFDVASLQVEPSTFTYDCVAKYLGCQVKEIFHSSTRVPSPEMGTFLTGLKGLVGQYKCDDVRNFDGYKESPPRYEVIQLNSKKSDDFLIDGMSFYNAGSLKFVTQIQPWWGGAYLEVFTHADNKAFNRELVDKAWKWAADNNFLKGEAFSLSGEFIPTSSDQWEDVFLAEKNRDILTGIVDKINRLGKQMPNRGVIMTGPPGTGKTLSGRIIRNTANATFIWVSARDFGYSGAFGGMAYAFDMAKTLAPSILFVEDIDNWMSSCTVDLLKTEMDGLKKSGVVTILTTNFPESLPEALIDRPGRFHDILHFALPDEKFRTAMVRRWLVGVDDATVKYAVGKTDGYSGAHMYELCQFAKSLKDADELSISDAVKQAIQRIDEQRDLITQLQSPGRHYRTPAAVAKSFGSVHRRSQKAKDTNEIALDLLVKAHGNEYPDWDTMHALRNAFDAKIAVEEMRAAGIMV